MIPHLRLWFSDWELQVVIRRVNIGLAPHEMFPLWRDCLSSVAFELYSGLDGVAMLEASSMLHSHGPMLGLVLGSWIFRPQ